MENTSEPTASAGLQSTCHRDASLHDLNCRKSFKNLSLHLIKKPECQTVYDMSSIEADSISRTRMRQVIYKQQNLSQTNAKKKDYRELNRDDIAKYNT